MTDNKKTIDWLKEYIQTEVAKTVYVKKTPEPNISESICKLRAVIFQKKYLNSLRKKVVSK